MTDCKHEYNHLRTDEYYQSTGRYSWKYVSVNTYFCIRCLDEKEVKKEHSCGDHELWKLPDWAKAITKRVYGDND